jgi:hypothetical protein
MALKRITVLSRPYPEDLRLASGYHKTIGWRLGENECTWHLLRLAQHAECTIGISNIWRVTTLRNMGQDEKRELVLKVHTPSIHRGISLVLRPQS